MDAECDKLYGHLVSGYPGTDTAYIIPACEIFHEMQTYLGKPVELSTPEKRASLRRRFELNQTPKSPAQTYSGSQSGKAAKAPRPAYVIEVDEDPGKPKGGRRNASTKYSTHSPLKAAFVEEVDDSSRPVQGTRRSASTKKEKSLSKSSYSDKSIKIDSDLGRSKEPTKQNDREVRKASTEKEKSKSSQKPSPRPRPTNQDVESLETSRSSSSRTGEHSRSGISTPISTQTPLPRPQASISYPYPRPQSYYQPYTPGSHISGPPILNSAFTVPPPIPPYYPLPYLPSHTVYGAPAQNQYTGYGPYSTRPPLPTRFDAVPRPSSAQGLRDVPTWQRDPLHDYDAGYLEERYESSSQGPSLPRRTEVAAMPPPHRPGILRRRDTEMSRDSQRVEIDVESESGRRRSYYGKSREYEDVDKFDTAASYEDDLSGPRIPLTAAALRRKQQLEESSSRKSTRKSGKEISSKRTSTTRATNCSVADDDEDVTIKFSGGEIQITREKNIRGGIDLLKQDRSSRQVPTRQHRKGSQQDASSTALVLEGPSEQTSSALVLRPEKGNVDTGI